MAKRSKFYSKTPAVPAKKIAGLNPVGKVELGSNPPPSVPDTPGKTTAWGGEPKHFFKIHLKPHRQHGHLRTSGHVGAHRVGANVKGITKIP